MRGSLVFVGPPPLDQSGGGKKSLKCVPNKNSSFIMPTSQRYCNISPVHYPNPEKRKSKGDSVKSSQPGEKKKKKEEKLPVIQNMTSVGLDASKKDKVQVLGRSPMTMILLWWWR